MTLEERRQFPGLKPSRADVVVAGALVLEELVRLGGYRGLLVAEHGVRHGMLLRETSSESVHEFGKRAVRVTAVSSITWMASD